MVKIAIDAMGGDFAPKQQVLGAVDALNKDKDLYLILCGDETQIKAELANCKYDASRLEIVHTTEVIGMNEIPTKAVKTYIPLNSSVRKLLMLLFFSMTTDGRLHLTMNSKKAKLSHLKVQMQT